MRRVYLNIIAAALYMACCSCGVKVLSTGAPNIEPEVGQTEILWDQWGIPYIYAVSEDQLFYAMGWVQARNHGDLLLRLYGQGRGRAAEYWGEQYVSSDRWVRTMGVPAHADWLYESQAPAFRRYLDYFADGVNDYAREHPDKISEDLKVVLPIDGKDVMAHASRVAYFSFVVNQNVLSSLNRWRPGGSNAWAIAPGRSESGHSMLLANPHLPWNDLYLFFEASLHAPGIDAHGVCLVGFPVLLIAFNDNLGWSHTINTHDGQDLFELTLAEGGYLLDGEVKAFAVEEQTIKIRQDNDEYREEKLDVRRSVHGPVLTERDGKAVALRIVGLDRPGMLEQWWDMARAENLGQFEEALKRLQIPTLTVMYADREGHIMHFFGGLTPKRLEGEWNWSSVVPGDRAALLWDEAHAYGELPRVLDPASGWLQNANDPPWTTTFPLALDPDDYPSYMAPRFMNLRAQRAAKLLAGDESISFAEMIDYQSSTRMELADRLVDDLVRVALRDGDETARAAAAVLSAWDRTADADSRGAVLFEAFVRAYSRKTKWNLYAEKWNEARPLTTPAGLSDEKLAVEGLTAAAKEVADRFGAMDIAWGEIYRLQHANVDRPASGAGGNLGALRVLRFMPAGDKAHRAVFGDSYVAAIEFSSPVKARAVLSYGNASQSQSPYLGKQLELFAEKKLRPIWMTRTEVEAHVSDRTVFGE